MFAAFTLASASSPKAADGFYLPPAPTGPGGEDSITTSQGVRCSQSINSSGGYLDLGVAGGGSATFGNDSFTTPDVLGYARIIIPMGQAPQRLNCNRLYEMEIERLQREIELLSIGLQ